MIDSSENRNHQLAFELQNSYVCEKCSRDQMSLTVQLKFIYLKIVTHFCSIQHIH